MSYKLGVSYFCNRYLDHVKEDLKEIKKRHCNYVLHTFDEIDLFYNVENMKRITKITHDMGLDVYYSPWAIGGVFGGECYSRFVMQYPDACQILSTGERVGNACLRHPQFRAYIQSWIEAASYAGGDVLFWDEPHLWIPEWNGRKSSKSLFACACPVCKADFKKIHGKPMPQVMTREVAEFRENTMVGFLQFACTTTKKVNPKLKNAVCLLPYTDKLWPNPTWEKVTSFPTLDIISTDPYWQERPYTTGKRRPLEGFVDLYAGRLADLARRHGKEAQGWLQLFGIPKRHEKDVTNALQMWEAAGVKNIAAWGFRACASYSLLESERPTECWKRLGDYYKKLSTKK